MKAYKFKLKPNKAFAAKCEQTLDVCRELYNSALRERIDAYRITGKSVNYQQQQNQLPEIKLIREDVAAVHSQVVQDPLRRVSRAFDSFFQRCLKGEKKAGFPRFKSRHRYNSFTYPQSGFRLEGDKLTLTKIGSCRLRLSRPIEGKIKTCTIKREALGWFCIFAVEESYSPFIPKTSESVGIDVGLENFATFSTGEVVDNPRYLRKAEREIKIAQRRVSKRKLRGSNRRKAVRVLARKHQKVANQRRDFFHKLSNQIIREFDFIAIEDLRIKNMLGNGRLAKSISDAAWGTFALVLSGKAESAGRKVVRVPAAYTSEDCSRCGERVRKTLATREHRCINPKCGLVMHRDHNSAITVLGRAGPLAREKVASPYDPRIPVL